MITEKDVYDNYVDQTTAAKMLNVTTSRINLLCREGRFKGAFKAGWSWLIPKSAITNFKPLKRGRKRHSDRSILENAIKKSNEWKEISL